MLINDTEILIIHKSFISNIYKGTYEPKEQHDDISSKEEVVLASPSFTDQKIKVTEELRKHKIVSTIIKRLKIRIQ